MSLVNAGPGGFEYTPATKFVFYTSTATSLAYLYAQNNSLPAWTKFSYPIVNAIQRQLAFSSVGQMLCGLALLYNFRIFERRMGTTKFSSFALFIVTVCSGTVQMLGHRARNFESGPLGLISACFVPYLLEVPAMASFRFLGISYSEKSFMLAASLQLALSGGPNSALPCLMGLLAGALYKFNFLFVKKFTIPSPIANVFSSTIGRLLTGSKEAKVRVLRGPGHQPGNAPAQQATVVADESHISKLEDMGFTRSQASSALQSTGNQLDNALTLLLGN